MSMLEPEKGKGNEPGLDTSQSQSAQQSRSDIKSGSHIDDVGFDQSNLGSGGAGRIGNTVDPEKPSRAALTGTIGLGNDGTAPTDALGYMDYAKALAGIITDSTTDTPLTIGICAPWGRGKSTLMKFIKDDIDKYKAPTTKKKGNPPGPERYEALTIEFDAWKYSRADQVWAGFIDVVLRSIEAGLNPFQKIGLAFKLNGAKNHPLVRYSVPFLILGVGALAVILGLDIPYWGADADRLTNLYWMIPSSFVLSLAACWKFLTGAWTLLKHPTAKRIAHLAKLPDYSLRLDPVHQITDDIKTLLKYYCEKTNKNRFVVFVDDIDRCQPEKIMEVLEAIKHFLDIKRFVFVIAMDARVVRHAIGKHYTFMGDSRHDREEMGRFYLEKLIQIPFCLPPLSLEQRQSLNDDVIQRHLEGAQTSTDEPSKKNGMIRALWNAIMKLSSAPETSTDKPGEMIESVRAYLDEKEMGYFRAIQVHPEFDISPRLLKRLVSVYLIARHILIQENDRKKDSKPDFVPPEAFVKWLALSVVYPFEAKALQKWLRNTDWKNPFGRPPEDHDPPFNLAGKFLLTIESKLSDGAVIPNASSAFAGLSWRELNAFGRAASAFGLNDYATIMVIKDTHHVTDCFNLVLD